MKHEQLLTDVFKAYYDARKHKRNTTSQLKFEVNMEDNLVKLAHDIESRQYEVERSICFIVTKPVKREVFAADFRDRVVHHLLYNYLSPLLERTFIHDCYSCRKGFGTLYGINRVAGNIRKCTQNFTRPAYVLKLDISGYFMSMNRKILLNKLVQILDKYARRRCGKEQLRWSEYLDYDLIKYLLEKVVLSNPTDGCIIRGNRKEWDGLPRNKSLFYAKKDCGLPIGNLTSQLFSNVYLTDFDHCMKRERHIRYYGRYVDDIIMIDNDRQRLKELMKETEDKMKASFGLQLHPKKRYLQHMSKGFEFLGMKQRRTVLVPGKRMKHNMTDIIGEYVKMTDTDIDYSQVKQYRSRINSYVGLLHHYASRRLCNDIRKRLYGAPNAYLLMNGPMTKTVINSRDIVDTICHTYG